MKHVDEFREPEAITKAAGAYTAVLIRCHYRIMEVCGGHTHAIGSFGLKDVFAGHVVPPEDGGITLGRLPWQHRGFNTTAAITRRIQCTSYPLQ
jgi:hypothetical protein